MTITNPMTLGNFSVSLAVKDLERAAAYRMRCSRNALGLAAAVLVTSCAGDLAVDGDDVDMDVWSVSRAIVAQEIDATLVASVALSATHSIEFWRFSDGGIHMREVGELADLENALDLDALARLSPSERFAALAGPAVPVPTALAEPAGPAPMALGGTGALDTVAPPEPPADGEAAGESRSGDAMPAGKSPAPGDTVIAPAWDWNADAEWWQSSFCTMNSVDHAWCPTNVTWADAGSVWGMYYETSCLAASFDQSASHTLERWDGSSWVLLASTTLSPRYWQKWIAETSDWYTSRCESIDTGGDSRVHFAHRVRWATPPVTTLADHPFDREYHDDLTDDIQGVSHDANNWYVANAEYSTTGFCCYSHIWKTPVSTNLVNNPSPYYANPWQGIYNHFGDLSHGAGKIFVALEKGDGSATWGAVGVFNTSLQYYAWAYWPWAGISDQGGSSPWVAYNPRDGLLYSSAFDASYINKYSWSLTYNQGWHLDLSFVDRIQIRDKYGNPITLNRLQGAEFSSTGKLYLSHDSGGYVRILDPYNGRVQTAIKVAIDYGSSEELEGITVWDLDNGAAPQISGQIHIQLLDNDTTSTDDLYFKHFRAATPDRL
jgi:hypothetical protein